MLNNGSSIIQFDLSLYWILNEGESRHSVTRLGDLLVFGQLFIVFGNN